MPPSTVLEDIEILERFNKQETKERAFKALVFKYQERLYWHVRRMVVTHEDSDDILQNTFIKVWNSLDKFRKEANLYTWLYRIATNEALTWIEQEKKRKTVSISDNEGHFSSKLIAEKGYDPNKIEWQLQNAIQSLPEKQKAVFCLRYYDEMPYEDMSVILETSIGALKASYHHAVKKVESFLKEH